jgi:hypothetical protein
MEFKERTLDGPIQLEKERSAQGEVKDKSQRYNHYPYLIIEIHTIEMITYLIGAQQTLRNALHKYPIKQAKENNTPRAKAMYP